MGRASRWLELSACVFCVLKIAILLGTAACGHPRWRSSQAGAAATEAYDLLEDDPVAACQLFLSQVRDGSGDPWSFRGLGRCAAKVEGFLDPTLEALASLPEDDALALFARHYFAPDPESQERLLRQALEAVPEFALAWNALGWIVLDEDPENAISIFEEALRLARDLNGAQIGLGRARLYPDVFQRLEERLAVIPGRWTKLRAPRIPISGRTAEEILAGGSEEAYKIAWDFITDLALTPLGDRGTLIESWLDEGERSEVDLWLPYVLASQEVGSRPDNAALLYEAWLEMAEKTGRRDALLFAASNAIDLLSDRASTAGLIRLGSSWLDLATTEQNPWARGHLLQSQAGLLLVDNRFEDALKILREASRLFEDLDDTPGRAGSLRGMAEALHFLERNREALAIYQTARSLFAAADLRGGEAEVLQGEADALSALKDYDRALEYYAKSRSIYKEAANSLGVANTLRGEADTLCEMGRSEEALEVYAEARSLYEDVGSRLGRVNVLEGEAKARLALGQPREALDLTREARELHRSMNQALGEADTWIDEASARFLLGENDDALHAYRAARSLYEQTGSELGIGESWLGEAEVAFRLGRTREALEAYRSAGKFLNAVDDPLGHGNSLFGKGEALFRLGEVDRALNAYRAARELFITAEDLLGQGHCLRGEATVLLLRGAGDKARARFGEARGLFKQSGFKTGQGDSFLGEAMVLGRLGRSAEALDAYRAARALYEAAKDLQGQGNAWKGEAESLFDLGKNHAALEAYRIARSLSERLGDLNAQAVAIRGEGLIFFFLNENEKAMAAYQQANTLFETVGNEHARALTELDRGDLFFRFGEFERALVTYRDARSTFDKISDLQSQGVSWLNEGDVHFLLDENDDALESYRRARSLYRAAGALNGQGDSWIGEGDVHYRSGESGQALAAYGKAREFFEETNNRFGLGGTLYQEGRISFERDDWHGAVRLARQAAEHFAAVDGRSQLLLAVLLEGRALDMARETDAAVAAAERAIALHDEWRATRITDQHRTQADQLISAAYDIIIPYRARQGRPASEILDLAEQSRSRALLDLLRTASSPNRGEVLARLRQAHQRFGRELARLERRITTAAESSWKSELERERERLERSLLWNRYELLAAQQNPMVIAQPVESEEVIALARQVGPILMYYVGALEIIAILVSPESGELLLKMIDVPWLDLTEKVAQLTHGLANPILENRSRQLTEELWQLLIAPSLPHLPADGPLILIPHSVLHRVPFVALSDPVSHRRLFERFHLSVVPSVSVLKICRRRHVETRRDDPFVAFSGGRGLALPQEEIREIARIFPSVPRSFVASAVDFSGYSEQASRARQILISTYGVQVDGRQTATYLEILPSEDHDSRLSAVEIATLPLEAELVTLAACDTAAGEVFLSDDRLDLTRAFLIAGAASVLATRWKVPEDDRTTRFLVDFYRFYRQGAPNGKGMQKDEALTEARRRSRESGDPAQVWAAWVLVGDPR